MDKSPKLYWRIYDGDDVKYVPATRENSLGEFPNMSYAFLEEWEKSTFVITEEFLSNGKSSNGGYSKQQRAKLGIDPPWPPSLFPIEGLVGQEIPMKDALEFLSLKDQHLQLDEIESKEQSAEDNDDSKRNLLPDWYPKNAPTIFSTKSGQRDVDRQKGRFDPAWDEPGDPAYLGTPNCPECGSSEIKAVGSGGAECKSCGYIF